MLNVVEETLKENYLKSQKVLGRILDGDFVKNEEQFKAALESQKHFAVMVGHETQRRGQNMRIIERMTSSPEEYKKFAQTAITALEIPNK